MIHVTDSGSVRNPMFARSAPAGNHVKRFTVFVRASSGRLSSAANITTDQTNASASINVASQPALGSPMRFPKSRRIAAPSSGSAGTIHARSSRSRALTGPPSSAAPQPLNRSMSSAVAPPRRRRKMATMMASPTATSAAATTSTKKTIA